MNPRLFLVLFPLLELAVLIQVGTWIGVLPVFALLLLGACVGALLIRSQGLAMLRNTQESLARRQQPAAAMFDGFCIALAGLLLIIPGFLTDLAALALLVPPVRVLLGRRLFVAVIPRMYKEGGVPGTGWPQDRNRGDRNRGPGPAGSGPVIDVDFREVDPHEPDRPDVPPPEGSKWRPPGRRSDR